MSCNTLDDFLFSRAPIADRDQHTSCGITSDATDEDDGSQRGGSDMVAYCPSTCTESDLKAAVHVEQGGNCHQKVYWKRKMRERLVRFVVGV